MTDILRTAIKTAQARAAAHKAVWDHPNDPAYVDAFVATMRAEQEAKQAYYAATGRVFHLDTVSESINCKAEAAMDRENDAMI